MSFQGRSQINKAFLMIQKTGFEGSKLGFILFLILSLNLWGCGGSKGSEQICQSSGTTVSGTATFENRVIDFNGFTGVRNNQPIRFADVEVVRNSNGSVIASGATNGSGFFCIDFGAPETDVYVRVLAKTNHPDYNLRVKNLGDTTIYSVKSNPFNSQDAPSFTKNLNATVNDGISGAYKILDTFERGVDFARQLTGTIPPGLRALWTVGSDPGTGFSMDPNGAFIQINGGADPDEYDTGVIYHEFGHFMSEVYSKDSSPGGPHSPVDNTLDIRLSWSEGWASFISGAIRNDRFILDVTGGDPPNNGFSLLVDLESTPSSVVDDEVYTTNELAVAKSLWDIFDNNVENEPFDGLNTGLSPIWDVITNYMTQTGVRNVSMEDFWEGWFLQGHNSLTEMENITKEFKMDFFEDSFENDDTPNSSRIFNLGSPRENHTIYPNGDVDYIAFDGISGQKYTIGTTDLKNGADTYLEILDSNGVLLIPPDPNNTNDNRNGSSYDPSCGQVRKPFCPINDQTTLSSEIVFTPSQTGLFYVRVKSSPNAPPSAGRLGTYSILITSP